MRTTTYLIGILAMLFLASCGANTTTETINVSSVELIEDFPMEGSNTLTGIWKVDLSGTEIDKVKGAKIKSAKISMTEPVLSDDVSEIILQLAASGASMQRIGVLNPVPKGERELNISIADKQNNLLDLLKTGEVTVVADINLRDDLEGELAIVVSFELELEVKQ